MRICRSTAANDWLEGFRSGQQCCDRVGSNSTVQSIVYTVHCTLYNFVFQMEILNITDNYRQDSIIVFTWYHLIRIDITLYTVQCIKL